MRGNGGFQVFNHLCNVYTSKTQLKLPSFGTRSKLKFNEAVAAIKHQYGYTSEDLCLLIDFMFVYDPLNTEVKSKYAAVQTMRICAPLFEQWKQANRSKIEEFGVTAVLNAQAKQIEPDTSEISDEETRKAYERAVVDRKPFAS